MILKLAIIAAVVLLGGVIYLNETGALFPITPEETDSFKNSLADIGAQATDPIEDGLRQSFDGIANGTNQLTSDIANGTNQLTSDIANGTNQLTSDIHSSVEKVPEAIFSFDLIESIQSMFDWGG